MQHEITILDISTSKLSRNGHYKWDKSNVCGAQSWWNMCWGIQIDIVQKFKRSAPRWQCFAKIGVTDFPLSVVDEAWTIN